MQIDYAAFSTHKDSLDHDVYILHNLNNNYN